MENGGNNGGQNARQDGQDRMRVGGQGEGRAVRLSSSFTHRTLSFGLNHHPLQLPVLVGVLLLHYIVTFGGRICISS